jgi:hypothetical protein
MDFFDYPDNTEMFQDDHVCPCRPETRAAVIWTGRGSAECRNSRLTGEPSTCRSPADDLLWNQKSRHCNRFPILPVPDRSTLASPASESTRRKPCNFDRLSIAPKSPTAKNFKIVVRFYASTSIYQWYEQRRQHGPPEGICPKQF